MNKLLLMTRIARGQSCSCRRYTTSGMNAVTADKPADTTADTIADIVVVGGGMVGTSLACALASSNNLNNTKIVLLETAPKESNKNWTNAPYENRVSSVTPGSQAFLQSIGVWDKVVERRCYPYMDMYVWDGVSTGNIHLNSADIHKPHMAHMVENSVLVESCMERAEELSSNIRVCFDSQIKEVHLPASSSQLASVELASGEVIKTKLVVGADGPNSYIRNKVGQIETLDYDYEQFGVVATLNVKSKGANTTAWQRFLPTGPLALLPMSQSVCSLVWSTSKENAKELMNDSEEVFIEKVNNAVLKHSTNNGLVEAVNDSMSKLLSVVQPGFISSRRVLHPPLVQSVDMNSRGMFPLQLKHSPYYVKTRMALVGDAAHRIHPMAGLGVNLGFGDAECLVRTIESSFGVGEDLGSLEELLPYETERQRHVVAVMGAVTGLHHLFSTDVTPLVLLRTVGLNATNNVFPVKDQIIKYAMQ